MYGYEFYTLNSLTCALHWKKFKSRKTQKLSSYYLKSSVTWRTLTPWCSGRCHRWAPMTREGNATVWRCADICVIYCRPKWQRPMKNVKVFSRRSTAVLVVIIRCLLICFVVSICEKKYRRLTSSQQIFIHDYKYLCAAKGIFTDINIISCLGRGYCCPVCLGPNNPDLPTIPASIADAAAILFPSMTAREIIRS